MYIYIKFLYNSLIFLVNLPPNNYVNICSSYFQVSEKRYKILISNKLREFSLILKIWTIYASMNSWSTLFFKNYLILSLIHWKIPGSNLNTVAITTEPRPSFLNSLSLWKELRIFGEMADAIFWQEMHKINLELLTMLDSKEVIKADCDCVKRTQQTKF
jgi:hypothetical protein